ncbi:MAG TPA: hypothetical protein VFR02_03585 [bacterium]|nr:hypothetical protein [bacterium]
MQGLRMLGQEWLGLWERIEKLKAEAKALEEQADELDRRMVEELQAAGERVVHLDGVGRMQLDAQLFVNVLAANKPEVLAWLKGDPEGTALVREDFSHSSLKAFVKERIAAGKEIPSTVGWTPVTRIKFVPAKRQGSEA